MSLSGFRCLFLILVAGFGPTAVHAQPTPQAPEEETDRKDRSAQTMFSNLPLKDVVFFLYKDYFSFGSKPDYVVLPRETWEAFQEQQRRLEQPKQQWTLSELAVRGDLEQRNETRLTVELQIRVDDPAGALVDLRMNEANFVQARSGSGETAPLHRSADNSYQLAIDRAGDFQYVFELFVDTERTPNENRLQLTLPTASVKRVILSSDEDVLFARNTATDERLEIDPDKRTIRPPLRAEDSLKLAWRTGEPRAAAAAPGLRSHGVISYRMAGSIIETEAVVTIDFGVQSQSCVFRLPLEEEVRSVTAVHSDRPEQPMHAVFDTEEADDHLRLRVGFDPTDRQIQLRIVSERPQPPRGDPRLLGFFETEQAEAQTGYILLFTKDDLWIHLDPKRGVRRVEIAQLDRELQSRQPVRAFQYNSQPAAIELTLATEPSITVNSDSRVVIDRDVARVVSEFRFQIRKAETSQLRLRVPNEMRIEEIEPLNLVRPEPPQPIDGLPSMKEIELSLSEPQIGLVEITLHGSTPVEEGKPLLLRLPAPVPELRWSGGVTVEAERGLTLEFDDDRLRDLRREQFPGERSSDRLEWYFRHDNRSEPTLACRIRPLSQEVDVAIDSRFRWQENRIVVESVLRYRTNHRQLETVALKIPSDLLALRITGGTRTSAGPLKAGPQSLQLVDPSSECDIELRYEYPAPIDGPREIQVPLVLPENAKITSYKGTVWCDLGMRVGADPSWESGKAASTDPRTFEDRPSLVVASDNPPETLGLRLDPSVALAPAVIPRVVVEEVLAGEGRRWGRLRFYFATHRIRELRVFVPDECQIAEVAVDGVATSTVADSPRVRLIRLPSTDRPCSVEIGYWAAYRSDRRLGSLRELNLTVPTITNDVAIQEVRWLIRARKDLLLFGDQDATAGSLGWNWLGYLQRPRSVSDRQRTLDWVRMGNAGVSWSESAIPPAEVSNCDDWVFETWGNAQRLRVWAAPHSYWVLLCSGLMLAIGLSISRSKAMVQLRAAVAVGAVVLAGTLLFPEATKWFWFGGQWGVYLVLAAISLRHLAVRRRRLRYMIGRTIRRSDGAGASLSSMIRRLHPEDRGSVGKMGTTIDA